MICKVIANIKRKEKTRILIVNIVRIILGIFILYILLSAFNKYESRRLFKEQIPQFERKRMPVIPNLSPIQEVYLQCHAPEHLKLYVCK